MAGMRVGNGLLPAKPGVNVGRGGQHKSWTAPSDALGYDNQTDFAWRRERLHIFPDEMGFPGFGRLKPQRDTSAPPAPRRMPNSEFAAINDFFSPEDIKVNEELRRKQKKERHRSRKLRRKEETEGADDLLDWLKNGNDADEHLSHDILFGRNSFVAKNRRHKPTLDDEEMLTEQLESDAIPPAGVLKTEHPRMLTQQQKEEILRQAKLKEGEICWDCGQVVWYENMEEDDDDEL